jgi:copper chaperone
MANTVTFAVTGEQKIHCAGCEERITNPLRGLPGIQDVQASHDTQRVAVTFDPTRVKPRAGAGKARAARLPRAARARSR